MKHVGLFAGLILVTAPGWSQVVINEFLYDDTSTNDDYEFVELFNAGTSSVDISGWKVQGVDTAVKSTITIPPATSLAAGGYYLIGKAAINAVTPVNLLQTVTLENGPDALTLRDASDTLVDSVVYERQGGTTGFLAVGEPVGAGIWGNNQAILNTGLNDPNAVSGLPDNGTFSLGRYVDGRDTNNNDNDFGLALATPGAPNYSKGTVNLAAPFTDNFDGAENTYSKSLIGNWFSFQIHDPLVADTMPLDSGNPIAIPASPQGGNVGIGWDATGGGNQGIFNLSAPVANVSVECYIYLASETLGTAGGADEEQWSFPVVRGKACGVYNHETANGDNGIRWKYRRNGNVVTMTLEDYRNNVINAIGSAITITAGVNDGWQRLFLSVNGATVQGALGGTLGSGISSGTVRTGTTAHLQSGGIGFGYRENSAYAAPQATTILTNPVRPITIDALTITDLGSSVRDWNLY